MTDPVQDRPARPRTYEEALAALAAARGPDDLFGGYPTDAATAARRYRRLARLLHPDTAPLGHRAEATAACAALNRLRAAQQAQPADLLTTRRHRFRVGDPIATGDVAVLRSARARPRDGGHELDAVLKISRHAADNDLMEREAHALGWLARHGDPRFRPYLPTLLETFQHVDAGDPAGAPRRVNALLRLDGFTTLAELRAAFPTGLDPRDAAWIWRRLLVALGHAHRTGVRHGAVLPEHVLVHLEEHGLVLVDWCYATTGPRAPAPALVERHRHRYPPEVAARRPVTEATDIHLASHCVAELMGGRAPREMRAFLAGCMLPAEPRRPHDAWKLLGELDQLLAHLYGPRTFRALHLPVA